MIGHETTPIKACMKAETVIKKNAAMAFYSQKEQLYLETNALGVSLGAGLVQVRDRPQYPKNDAPDSATLWPVIFVSKRLTSGETHYSNI